MGDDPADRRETVALVTDELKRMNRMVNDLLLLARAEQPDFLQLTDVDVTAMLSDVYVKAAPLGVRDWRLGPVEAVTLAADRQQLEQAVMQLVQNAVQYTDEGDAITLSARVEEGCLRLAVQDTGIGIDPSDQERIVERFWRAEPGRQRAEGAGLGLAIVTAIANAHRGRLAVDSSPGVGSTFTLVIPLDPGTVPEGGPA
jgi:signal transduction histidine kinase